MLHWTATSDSSVAINTSAASIPSSNSLHSHRTKHTLRSIFAFTARMAATGAIRESEGSANSLDIDALARFAVDHHNNKQNALLEFKKVSNVKEQVVAGTMYYITLEAAEGGSSKVYEAKVWVKPWMNFKQVEDFKHVGDA